MIDNPVLTHQQNIQPTITKPTAFLRQLEDVFFDTDSINSWDVGNSLTAAPTVSAAVLLQPLSRGYGDVKSLHYALTENTALMTKLNTITSLNIATQMTSVDKHISEFLTLWAGKTGIAALDRAFALKPTIACKTRLTGVILLEFYAPIRLNLA